MFKKLLVITLLTGGVGLLASGVQSDNGKAGKTGSPNELTCHDCHDDFTQGRGGGSVALTSSNMPGWEYVPGTTYHMTCTVSRATMPLFGLGVECLTSTNANAGTLTITDATHTSIKSATVSGVSRKNVVHKLNGGVATGSKAFTFDWVAPATNIGNVTFYFAGVAANADGDEAVGDYVYVGNQVVTPATSTGMIEQQVGVSFSVYPNPAHETMSISYELPAAGNVDCALYDLQGHRVRQMIMAQRQPGKHVEMIDGLGNLAAGNYLLISDLNGARQTRMVMLQP
jgi:hypothetical protein